MCVASASFVVRGVSGATCVLHLRAALQVLCGINLALEPATITALVRQWVGVRNDIPSDSALRCVHGPPVSRQAQAARRPEATERDRAKWDAA